jgi:serine protease
MKYLLALAVLFPASSSAMMTVAVIDTGLHKSVIDLHSKPNDSWYEKGICKYGHRDFTGSGDIHDRHGHGTNISGLIHHYAGDSAYCMVIIKFYDPSRPAGNHMNSMIRAIQHAIDINVDIINISAGGVDYSETEHKLINKALDKGILVIAAAGNERSDKPYYPASYSPRIASVGAVDSKGNILPSSNYGRLVTTYEYAHNRRGTYGSTMTGTSQAAAVHTGKRIKEIHEHRRKKLMELFLQRKAAV